MENTGLAAKHQIEIGQELYEAEHTVWTFVRETDEGLVCRSNHGDALTFDESDLSMLSRDLGSERAIVMRIHRIASGDYETADGRFRIYVIPDLNPPAWNVEGIDTGELVVDGAATKRDAVALLQDIVQNEEE